MRSHYLLLQIQPQIPSTLYILVRQILHSDRVGSQHLFLVFDAFKRIASRLGGKFAYNTQELYRTGAKLPAY